MRQLGAITFLAVALFAGFAPSAASAASRAHVYLFRGLADIFSTGMDTLADEINKRGVYATSHSHTEWKALADQAAVEYKAGKEGPIILVGHSLGADAVMEMADYLGDKGVPVALVMPFDGTQSFPASANISRVVNFTQRDYAYMRRGPGFRGTLVNVDLSSDPNIGHLNIDKSARLHARAITEILAVAVGHMGPPVADKPPAAAPPGAVGGATRHEDIGRSEEQRGIEHEAPAAPLVSPVPRPPKAEEATAPRKPETSESPSANMPLQAPAAPVSPAFPPQPPPPRPVPVKPMEIPD